MNGNYVVAVSPSRTKQFAWMVFFMLYGFAIQLARWGNFYGARFTKKLA